MDLAAAMKSISDQIKRQRKLMTSEQATINVAIQPFIRALGYDTNNLAEASPEYTADPRASGAERVDYAILRDGKPILLIEVKAAGKSLTDDFWRQLHDYFAALDVQFGILTNGLEFRFYTDLEKSNIMDRRPFMTIDMLDLDERLLAELTGFTKAEYDPARILASARKLKALEWLHVEFTKPSDRLLDVFASRVYPGKANARVRREFRPIFVAALREFVSAPSASPAPATQPLPPKDKPASAKHKRRAPKTKAVAAAELESAIPIPVFAKYMGNHFDATLLLVESNWKKSFIRFKGNTFKPSESTLIAMRPVNPNLTNTRNGWSFWKLRDPEGNRVRKIGDLRDDAQLLARLRTS